jgi:hypothetical protein
MQEALRNSKSRQSSWQKSKSSCFNHLKLTWNIEKLNKKQKFSSLPSWKNFYFPKSTQNDLLPLFRCLLSHFCIFDIIKDASKETKMHTLTYKKDENEIMWCTSNTQSIRRIVPTRFHKLKTDSFPSTARSNWMSIKKMKIKFSCSSSEEVAIKNKKKFFFQLLTLANVNFISFSFSFFSGFPFLESLVNFITFRMK